jgi:pyruvate ferredoxin oxidoreductase beta subunit
MKYNFKEEMNKPERFSGGHRMCAGCGAPIVVRTVLRALEEDDKAAIVNATGCLEAATFPYPYTAWEDSWLHSAFENAGASASGVSATYLALKKRGKVKGTYKTIAFGGDGGTYDIGFQSLSGAMERGHDITYVCYDNEAYMNTGIQRSSGTSRFADTTTSPAGSVVPGKQQNKKNLTDIMIAHNIPYVAQPCPRGWRYDTPKLMEMTKLAVETCYWPMFEVENGVYNLNYKPKNKLPIEEFLKPQGRFKHLFQKGNEWMVEEFQAEVDRKWEVLLRKCGE